MKFSDIRQYHRPNTGFDLEMKSIPKWLVKQTYDGQSIDLDPDFQRGHVWSSAQQTRYVEYVLRGGAYSRTILWNHPTWTRAAAPHCDLDQSTLVLVDGKQRLTAISMFIENHLPVFDGHLYRDFEDHMRLGQSMVRMEINDLQTRRELLEWYLDLNSGGVVHSDQEIERVRRLLDAESKP